MSDIRVLLADDQDLVRRGFRMILESEPGLVVVGEARNGEEAVREAARLQPDVVCLDVEMPGMDGLEAARRITAAADAPAVLILTTFDRDDYLFAALQAGASGFLLKTTSPEKLIEAVLVVAAGDALLAPDVTRRVIERSVRSTAPAAAPVPALAELTEREREVLHLLAKGLSNAEIAGRLYLGEATVKTHVSKVLQKLGLRDRIQAVVFAHENGLTGG
jgi:DNA-binding NarL/FixJ family response regulator